MSSFPYKCCKWWNAGQGLGMRLECYIVCMCFSLVFTWRAAEVICGQPRAARKVPASWVWGKKELISKSCRHWFRKIRSRVEETWVWKKGSVVLPVCVIVVCTSWHFWCIVQSLSERCNSLSGSVKMLEDQLDTKTQELTQLQER